MRLEDEYGVTWVVESGDPSRVYVNLLKRIGFDWIVLPRYTLMTGKISRGDESPDYIRGIRLRDCVGRLSE